VVTAYVFYIAASLGMVVWVGQTLYRNGAVFLRDVFDGEDRVVAVNRLLLVGFYLISIGFVLLTSSLGTGVESLGDAYRNLSIKLGAVALVLGVMHVMNLSVLNRARRHRLMENRRLATGRPPGAPYGGHPAPAPAPY
jgi:hypothetical protein